MIHWVPGNAGDSPEVAGQLLDRINPIHVVNVYLEQMMAGHVYKIGLLKCEMR